LDDRTSTLGLTVPPAPLTAIVRVLNAPAVPATFRLESGCCRIGASRAADVVVSDETVSRLHVELSLSPEGVLLTDLGSRNGCYYLGQRVEKITLSLGSTFRIGRTEIAVEADRQTLDRLAPVNLNSYGSLIGISEAMRRLFAVLLRLENSLVSVLLQGESGTGKELCARAIHEHSAVASGPFVAVNCAALDRALARSELFGHRKGAFTGASEAHVGAFEAASGGTLLLDEVGELPVDVQPVLLRVLETGALTRVGDNTERPVRVRIIAATNRDLSAEVEAGNFRQDLYFRLAVVKLGLKPLRERVEDIEPLARKLAAELGIDELAPEILADFRTRPWPGNARELRNALSAYAALGAMDGPLSGPADELEAALCRWLDATRPYAAQKDELLKAFQRLYLRALLEHTGGNQSEAARISGIDRSYLSKVLTKR
jgi:DNA-binding NtrC family response regulator